MAGHQNGTVSVWNMQRKQLLRYFNDVDLAWAAGSFAGIEATLSPDLSMLLTPLFGETFNGKSAAIYDVVTGRRIRTFGGHSEWISSVAFSPDGKFILTGSEDKTAILWDISMSRRIQTFEGHSEGVYSVAFSPDGKSVLTGSYDDTVILWNVATGKRLRTFEDQEAGVSSFPFSPDGKFIITGSIHNKTAILWDVATGKRLRAFEGHDAGVSSFAFSSDGKSVLIATGDNTMILRDVTTGQHLRTFKENNENGIRSVAFSPDGKSVLTGYYGNPMILWDVETERKLSSFDLSTPGRFGTYLSPSKNFLANNLGVFSIDTGKMTMRLDDVSKSAISPDEKNIFVVSNENNETFYSLWDITSGERLHNFKGHGKWIKSIEFSPHGDKILITDSDGTILWDIAAEARLWTFVNEEVNSVVFSPDGNSILTCSNDKTAVIRDIATMDRLQTFEGHRKIVNTAVFSPDGSLVLTGSDDNTAILWDRETGNRLQIFEGHSNGVKSVIFSPDGKSVITNSYDFYDHTVILWNITRGQPLHTFESDKRVLSTILFSPDSSKLFTMGSNDTIHLWDFNSGKLLQSFDTPSQEFINTITFDESGNHILATGVWRPLYVWDVATGKPVAFGSGTHDGILFTTPEGHFDGPSGVRNKVAYRIGESLNILPVDQFFDGFYYPDLYKSILRGERPLPKVTVEAPPKIRILSPVSRITTEQEQATVEAVIDDQGGGIQKPVVKLNGSEYLVDELPVRENEKQLRWRFTIPLISGVENIIEVHSAASNGAIASQPARIIVDCEKPKKRPELYMVAVGISDYADGQRIDLKCARNDAEVLAKTFRERGELFYGKGKVHVKTVVDSQATMAGIQQAIAEVAKAAKPRDIFILTLSGHGVTLGERYYFIPYDYKCDNNDWQDERVRRQGLPEDKLDDWIASVPATKRVLVYDTCQSGSALGRSTSYEKTLESLARRSGCHVIAAAASNEQAEELPDIGHGALTYALIAGLGASDKGLLKNRSATSKDGMIGVLNWFQFAAENVPAITKLSLGKEQYIEFKSKAGDFPILPVKTKEQDQ